MSIIVDCSVAMAWVLRDEASPYANGALDTVVAEGGMVPELWWLETRNVLLMAERRNRITQEDVGTANKALNDLGLIQDRLYVPADVLTLAREHDLTSYDGIYLEAALRLEAPLATLDKKLAGVAKRAGVYWEG